MPLICLTTVIAAPVHCVFDLSRSIDLHKASMQRYEELPVAGKTNGLIDLHETVTWQARHLFKMRTLQVKITAMEPPFSFTDEMIAGDFRAMKHAHHFQPCAAGTIMTDNFWFETPYGLLGKLVDKVWLTRYMENLLRQRNQVIKATAEKQALESNIK